jgi:tetratricopeptide (TPR) repeat protein
MQRQTTQSICLFILLFSSFNVFSQGLFIERNKAYIDACYENTMSASESALTIEEKAQPCARVLNDDRSHSNNKAMASHNLAAIYFNAGDFMKAEKYAKKSIRLARGQAETHILLGHIYYNSNNLQLAAEAYKKVLSMDSSNVIAAKNLKVINSKLYTLTAKH